MPYNPFTDKQRFSHQWCLGDNGSGKTTFFRRLIKTDMDRAARDECSLVVIDSKTLVHEMRTLREFGPEGPLDGRLILIDAEKIFPLNPFRMLKPDGTPDQPRGTAILEYMLAGLSDASELQEGVMRHYIDAAYAFDSPTLYTIRDLMMTPKGEPPANFKRMDDDTQKWFMHTRKGVASLTSGGAEQRLVDFLARHKDKPLVAMLNADSFALDMGDIDRGGAVLLVDTNRDAYGKAGAAILGRLVIALVDELATSRTRRPGTPVFCYIDEAQDYIAKDEIFAETLEKARSSKISMTIAHHHTKQGGGFLPGVVAALEHTCIHSRCRKTGLVELVKLEERLGVKEGGKLKPTILIPVEKFEFDEEDQMDRPQYDAMRELLARKHPYRKSRKPKDADDEPLVQKKS